MRIAFIILVVVVVSGLSRERLLAQEGSLLQTVTTDEKATPLTLENASFLFQPLPPEAETRALQREDIITVLVDYRASMLSEGDAQSRKTASMNAQLLEWLAADGGDIFAAPQRRGDPKVSGTLNSQYRAQSDIEVNDSLTFRIAAKIVDIRPNGNLVIEAHRRIVNNDEVWLASLSGVVRRQSIGPDRTVRSDAIADLIIDKREDGQVRDGYAAGWLNQLWGKYKPF